MVLPAIIVLAHFKCFLPKHFWCVQVLEYSKAGISRRVFIIAFPVHVPTEVPWSYSLACGRWCWLGEGCEFMLSSQFHLKWDSWSSEKGSKVQGPSPGTAEHIIDPISLGYITRRLFLVYQHPFKHWLMRLFRESTAHIPHLFCHVFSRNPDWTRVLMQTFTGSKPCVFKWQIGFLIAS